MCLNLKGPVTKLVYTVYNLNRLLRVSGVVEQEVVCLVVDYAFLLFH